MVLAEAEQNLVHSDRCSFGPLMAVQVVVPWGEEVSVSIALAETEQDLVHFDLKVLGHMHGVAGIPHPHHCKPISERQIHTYIYFCNAIKKTKMSCILDSLQIN
ncbi:hypothetical protein EYF80_066525 [Liparis tanakae]|uniref:Uncharacterized protein n=1 Tax=Liparis tanakae TaxID=230148 RepID=A0A4Z2E3R1_9TELE|nr:hypothetical protein EYF80_066525 [Liparis tanakae]